MIKKEKVNKYKREKIKREEAKPRVFGFDVSGDYAYIPYKLKKFCVSIKKISLLEKNPRFNDKASEKLAILIKENGFRKPIVIDQDGKVRAGNTAYKAARMLGMKFIPAAESDFAGEAEAMRYVVSDNKASEYSYWDTDLLKELVGSQKLDSKENIKGLGLSDTDLQKLFVIKEEQEKKNLMEVVVTVATEEEAEKLVNHLRMHEYACRVVCS